MTKQSDDEINDVRPITSSRAAYVPNLSTRIPDVNIDASLPEWKDYIALKMAGEISDRIDDYLASSYWSKRTKGVTVALLFTTVKTMTEYIYDQHRRTLKTWNKAVIVDALTNDLVDNLDYRDQDVTLIVPAISDFLTFLCQIKVLDKQRTERYQRFMHDAEPEMVKRIHKVCPHTPLRRGTRDMVKAGLSLMDVNVVSDYYDDMDAMGTDRITEEDWEEAQNLLADDIGFDDDDDWDRGLNDDFSAPELPDSLVEAIHNPIALEVIANTYDPDDEEFYLSLEHVTSRGKHKWSEDGAREVHKQAVKMAITLWLTRADHNLPNGWNFEQLLVELVNLLDTFYSELLLPPEEWTITDVKDMVGILEEQAGPSATKELDDFLLELATTLKVLAEDGTIDNDKAMQFAKVMHRQSATKSIQQLPERLKKQLKSHKKKTRKHGK